MSKHYETVKRNYDNGSWDIHRVRDAVVRDWITEIEYEEITGEVY